jgi:hypothetical protein
MKRLLKFFLLPIWRASGPIRVEADRRIESWFRRTMEPKARQYAAEFSPGIDGMLRELMRLQEQVDALQATIDAMRVGEDAPERAKAG